MDFGCVICYFCQLGVDFGCVICYFCQLGVDFGCVICYFCVRCGLWVIFVS